MRLCWGPLGKTGLATEYVVCLMHQMYVMHVIPDCRAQNSVYVVGEKVRRCQFDHS